MHSSEGDDDAGFWPGYVAAVSGLVQGLLIMAMALGVSIFALSQVGSTVGALPGKGPEGKPPAAPALATPSAPASEAEAETPPPASGEEVRPMRIAFMGDAVVLPPSIKKVIGDAIESRKALGVARWRVALTTDLEDPRARRAGYLRVMGVRALLMDAGFSGEAIDLQLQNGSAEGEEDGSSAVIVSPVNGVATAQISGGISAPGAMP